MNHDCYVPIDYTIWAEYWDLLEHQGLEIDFMQRFIGFVDSPCLVVGSGQGLLSEFLEQRGYEVVNNDSCTDMAVRAKQRRQIETIVGNIVDIRLPIKFKTVVISTGIINELAIAQNQLYKIINSIDHHLIVGGSLILAYFRRTFWTDLAEKLGLYGVPSNNVLFWKAQGALERAANLFGVCNSKPRETQVLFDTYRECLNRHMNMVCRIGERHETLCPNSADLFIERHSGYYPFSLSAIRICRYPNH